MRNGSTLKFRRITASVAGIAMLVVLLFSAFYIASEVGHDCAGEDCPTCSCLEQCENALNQIGGAETAQPGVALVAVLAAAVLLFSICVDTRETPVSRKVRLND